MSPTPQVISDDQTLSPQQDWFASNAPKASAAPGDWFSANAPKAAASSTPTQVQLNDEEPKPVKPAPVQVLSPEQAHQQQIAKANIAQYPENQPAPDPDYVARKRAWEAIQT